MKKRKRKNVDFREIITCAKWNSSIEPYVEIDREEYTFGGEIGPIFDNKGKIMGVGRLYRKAEYMP